MSYPPPPTSKSAVRRAGKAISEGVETQADLDLVDQWRASHGYVINTFQMWIKRQIASRGMDVEFAQRLKRRNTVIDKLRRKNSKGEPLIADVSAMNDFAGCRVIFNDIDELHSFREHMMSPAVMKNVKHELRYEKDKYNYIERPKFTGYRGIHDVYRHLPRGSNRKEVTKPWDGLLVEVQYRTRAQHAWATAVEISDLIDTQKTKFEMDQSLRGRFFAIASEIIARKQENWNRAFNNKTTAELQADLQVLEDQLGILRRLSALKQFEDENLLRQHNVLNIVTRPDGSLGLEVFPFSTAAPAIAKATELEQSVESLNAVYVRSDKPNQLRSAYRNYFNDPIDFVKILEVDAGLESQLNAPGSP